jgi:hypothetical protein
VAAELIDVPAALVAALGAPADGWAVASTIAVVALDSPADDAEANKIAAADYSAAQAVTATRS